MKEMSDTQSTLSRVTDAIKIESQAGVLSVLLNV